MGTVSINMEEGLIILIIGMGMVFLSLILLHLVFQHVVPYLISLGKKKTAPVISHHESAQHHSGEEMAAIAAAVYMFLEESHDEENAILTISKSSKSYSPWNSKIYATHNLADYRKRS